MGKIIIFRPAYATTINQGPPTIMQRVNYFVNVVETIIGQIPRRNIIAFEISGAIAAAIPYLGTAFQIGAAVVTIVVGYFTIRSHRAKKRAEEAAARASLSIQRLNEIEIEIKQRELARLEREDREGLKNVS
jgi:hypothetical protein